MGSVFVLKRLKRGDSSVWETFTNHGVQGPLCLNREDAEGLAEILNEDGRFPVARRDGASVPLPQ